MSGKRDRDNETVNWDADSAEDEEIRALLAQWKVPDTPASLDSRVLDAYRRKVAYTPFWKRFFNISFPMPVAATIAAALLFMVIVYPYIRTKTVLIPASVPLEQPAPAEQEKKNDITSVQPPPLTPPVHIEKKSRKIQEEPKLPAPVDRGSTNPNIASSSNESKAVPNAVTDLPEKKEPAIVSEKDYRRAELEKYMAELLRWRSAGDRAREADALYNIGLAYFDLGENEKALDYFYKARALFRADDRQQEEARTLIRISRSCRAVGEKEKAEEYQKQAVALLAVVNQAMVVNSPPISDFFYSGLNDWRSEDSSKAPPDWKVENLEGGKWLTIKGEPKLGFPKDIRYKDFDAFFTFKMSNGKGIAWAVRVQGSNFDSYYLFYLRIPDNGSAELRTYVVHNGKFDLDKPKDITPCILKLSLDSLYSIEIKARGNRIDTFITAETGPAGFIGKSLPLGSYTDKEKLFLYGNIGFRTVDGEMIFRIKELHLKPIEK